MDRLRGRGIGVIVLCVFLIFAGLAALFHLQFQGEETIQALFELGAGVLILLGI